MPILTRLWIKTALVYFILALLLGILLALDSANLVQLRLQGLFPSYVHFLTIGWITQLIMGVVFWMFPKYTQEKPRRSDRAGWVSLITLNAGLVLRLVGEPLYATTQERWAGWMMAIAALLLWVGGAAFVVNTWGRVKEK
ncbi:MAG: hypothetical protein ACYC3H_08095 [Bellilinea sp.]